MNGDAHLLKLTDVRRVIDLSEGRACEKSYHVTLGDEQPDDLKKPEVAGRPVMERQLLGDHQDLASSFR